LKLYNSLTRQMEAFTPQADGVTLYACGITPYDTTHLGHAFTYTTVDVLVRYLGWLDVPVRYVQNVTDIDDDILRRAQEVDEDWRVLGNRWTRHFIADMQALNVIPPGRFPRATQVIPEIVERVERLLEAGVAYEAGGSVYFEISAWPEYGKLAGLPREEMLPIANERGNNPDDPNKRDPLDFVLWQKRAAGEPAWDSPWGPGRPGWHIECSTMAACFLGERIDIHAGGADLLFPHHECEIAQVEPLTNEKPFVHTWLHIAMVRHQGEKMSKSLGNLVMVRDLLQDWSPDALRLTLAGHHYREAWCYSEDELESAERLAGKLRRAMGVTSGDSEPLDLAQERAAYKRAMDNDLDAPSAIAVLHRAADGVIGAAQEGRNVGSAQRMLQDMAKVFGLRLDSPSPDSGVIKGWREIGTEFEMPEKAR
jgi:L-cysteine:1D-myo-inositol 2-amino-2-deoxy-alpha-D-glucopyranoside ligase